MKKKLLVKGILIILAYIVINIIAPKSVYAGESLYFRNIEIKNIVISDSGYLQSFEMSMTVRGTWNPVMGKVGIQTKEFKRDPRESSGYYDQGDITLRRKI